MPLCLKYQLKATKRPNYKKKDYNNRNKKAIFLILKDFKLKFC